jgi:hypothetical protein
MIMNGREGQPFGKAWIIFIFGGGLGAVGGILLGEDQTGLALAALGEDFRIEDDEEDVMLGPLV